MSIHEENNGRSIDVEKEQMRSETETLKKLLVVKTREYQDLLEQLRIGVQPIARIVDLAGGNLVFVRLGGDTVVRVVWVVKDIPLTDDVIGKWCVLSMNRAAVLDVFDNIKTALPMQKSLVEFPDTTYADVVGLDEQLKLLRQDVEWVIDNDVRSRRESIIKDSTMLNEAGVTLLYGPPGVGKTYLAKSIAGTIAKRGKKVAFMKVESNELITKWMGESSENVRILFKTARDFAPTILFMDEVDALMQARQGSETDAGRELHAVVNTFLTELGEGFYSNKNVAVLLSTNFPQVLDRALLDRVKRFIYVAPPKSRDEIERLMEFYLSKVRCDDSLLFGSFDELFRIIEKRKQSYEVLVPERGINIREAYSVTPRDIKNVVQEAVNQAIFDGKDQLSLDIVKDVFEKMVAKNQGSKMVS